MSLGFERFGRFAGVAGGSSAVGGTAAGPCRSERTIWKKSSADCSAVVFPESVVPEEAVEETVTYPVRKLVPSTSNAYMVAIILPPSAE